MRKWTPVFKKNNKKPITLGKGEGKNRGQVEGPKKSPNSSKNNKPTLTSSQ